MEIKRNIRFKIINKISLITGSCLFYLIFSFCNLNSTNLKVDNDLEPCFQPLVTNINKENHKNDLVLNNLQRKIDIDLYVHNVKFLNNENHFTQLSINKEGKIIGYKSSHLKKMNYLIESSINSSLKKSLLLNNKFTNIYWLNLDSL